MARARVSTEENLAPRSTHPCEWPRQIGIKGGCKSLFPAERRLKRSIEEYEAVHQTGFVIARFCVEKKADRIPRTGLLLQLKLTACAVCVHHLLQLMTAVIHVVVAGKWCWLKFFHPRLV